MSNSTVRMSLSRNYDEDFEDDEDAAAAAAAAAGGAGSNTAEQSTTKRLGLGGSAGNTVSPPQRIGSGNSHTKMNDSDERWKD